VTGEQRQAIDPAGINVAAADPDPGSGPGSDRVPADFPFPIVLGIDPGTVVLGFGAIVLAGTETRLLSAGVIRAPSRMDVPSRLAHMKNGLEDLFVRLRPQTVVVEQAFAARNIQSALRIGEGRGVVLASAVAYGAEVVQYAPAAAKKSVVGHGGADKSQVARMVGLQLGIEALSGDASGIEDNGGYAWALDATDALALALTHILRTRRQPGSPTSWPSAR
jgi:crossover junction endodeoxyribonuclease RuvC